MEPGPVQSHVRERLLTSSRPLPDYAVVKGEGSWLVCQGGRRMFDGSSGLLCVNVGHSSTKVKKRVREQLDRFSFAGPAVIYPDAQLELTQRLTAMVDRRNDYLALLTSGTLGVETAVALARIVARQRSGGSRHIVLTSNLSYHGMSAYTLAIAGNGVRRPRKEDAFGLEPCFQAPYPSSHTQSVDCQHICDAECAIEVAQAIDIRGAENVAAVLLEPVNGTTGGAFVPPKGYHQRVIEICRDRGVLVIHDEVLTGLWRCGKPLASDQFPGSSPDICILSKGLGAGYTSAAAVLMTPELGQLLRSGAAGPLPAMGTMAASPLQAATCLGVLDELETLNSTGFGQKCTWLNEQVMSLTEFELVKGVRGLGFLYGVELREGCLWRFMEKVESRGVFFYPFSYALGAGVMIAPPLNSSFSDLEYMMKAIHETLDEMNEGAGRGC